MRKTIVRQTVGIGLTKDELLNLSLLVKEKINSRYISLRYPLNGLPAETVEVMLADQRRLYHLMNMLWHQYLTFDSDYSDEPVGVMSSDDEPVFDEFGFVGLR